MQQLDEVEREVKLCSYIDGGPSGMWTFANGSSRKIKKISVRNATRPFEQIQMRLAQRRIIVLCWNPFLTLNSNILICAWCLQWICSFFR